MIPHEWRKALIDRREFPLYDGPAIDLRPRDNGARHGQEEGREEVLKGTTAGSRTTGSRP